MLSTIVTVSEKKFGVLLNACARPRGDYFPRIKRDDAPLPDRPFMTIRAYISFNHGLENFENGCYDMTENDSQQDFETHVGRQIT